MVSMAGDIPPPSTRGNDMKAILIDAKAHEVREVETGDYKTYYPLLNCQTFTAATYLPNNDCLLVDDEGLLNAPLDFFTYEGAHQPFAGNGLFIGSSEEGETIPVKTTLAEVQSKVKFLNVFQVQALYAGAL